MAVDPTQLKSQMSLDKSGDFICSTPKLGSTNNTNSNIDSSNSKNKSAVNKPKNMTNIIEFIDTPFAHSVIPNISLLGITDTHIKKLTPSQSAQSWVNIGAMDRDIEDCAYLLLDNKSKLLRVGGLLKDKYVNTVSICDLKQNFGSNNNGLHWISLPSLNTRRHGHKTLQINIFNKPHIIALGGFDSKGNTLTKSEIIPLQSIKTSLQNNNSEMNTKWSMGQCMELNIGISDFGVCNDAVHNRVYICGGLDSAFKSQKKCCMFDIQSNKCISLPQLNYDRHCNQCELLMNPNILMTFGGWTGMARNTIEIIDLRQNSNKWECNIGNGQKHSKGFGIFSFPHSNGASTVKCVNGNGNNIEQKMNGLNINSTESKSECKASQNVVIVCGHKEGLFMETNVIEALEMRTKTWHTIATFKYGQNCNINQNIINAQQTPVPHNNSHIDLKNHHRFAHAFRYLTLL